MGIWSPVVLNAGPGRQAEFEQRIDVALTLAMADLKAKFLNVENGTVRYGAIRGSEEFSHYEDLTKGLRSFHLRSLDSRNKRLAFWINIYNTAVIHAIIELGLRQSVKEFSRFFRRVSYEIGGHRFSLNDMEHGILRGNRRPPYGLMKPFRKNDPRLEFAVLPMDPRIHFALVCGARSCPPIGFYQAEQIDFQLQLAAASFINSPQVKILPQEMTILLSMIFKWYAADFGASRTAVIDTLLNFMDEGEGKTFLQENKGKIRIGYQPYDWNLNE
jgi:hypothetical protein